MLDDRTHTTKDIHREIQDELPAIISIVTVFTLCGLCMDAGKKYIVGDVARYCKLQLRARGWQNNEKMVGSATTCNFLLLLWLRGFFRSATPIDALWYLKPFSFSKFLSSYN